MKAGNSLRLADIDSLDFAKGDGLVAAVVQHADTGAVLMVGFMNRESVRETLSRRHVVFYSRTRRRLWEKGETSGNYLELDRILPDCDADTLLVTARPLGPACHQGTATCFGDEPVTEAEQMSFLGTLEAVIERRIAESPQGSYTARLYSEGPKRIAQKVGEEGLEVALAAVTETDDKLLSESADLLFHLLVLLRTRGLSFTRLVQELQSRHAAKP
jgi:phosphoribosyl-AMP cyclohydrolase / phosphoribosyl-ATP pyrophosphohydrolase